VGEGELIVGSGEGTGECVGVVCGVLLTEGDGVGEGELIVGSGEGTGECVGVV